MEQKIKVPKVVKKYLLIAVVVAAILIGGAIGFKTLFATESQTTELGFGDIGELATQTVSATEVNVTDKAHEFYGVKIPFTQSKYIYSYNVEIQAGLDFTQIESTVDDTAKTIELRLPEVRILSTAIDPASFKLYHEEESLFQQISLAENNQALIDLQNQAEQDALDNGLLEKARANAEVLLKAFVGQLYDLTTYQLTIVDA